VDCSCYDVNPGHRDDPDHCLNCGICIPELTLEEKSRLYRIDGRWTLLPVGIEGGIVYREGTTIHTNVNGKFHRIKASRILKYLRRASANGG
jgi:hypothetical protein